MIELATYEDATQLVKHPVLGGIQPLHVLLGPAHHLDTSLVGSKVNNVWWSPPEEKELVFGARL